ncbi:MAG: DUF3108 domain-containing protein [Planctomycetota bacterium]|jgi:hypothetical protein
MNWVRFSATVSVIGLAVATTCLCTTCTTTPPITEYTPDQCKKAEIEFDPDFKDAVRLGERHTYDVYLLTKRAGTAILEVGPMKRFAGRRVYSLLAHTRSSSYIEAIYPVRDNFESYIDDETFLPVWFEEHHKRRGREGHVYLDFDRTRRFVKTYKWKKSKGQIMRRALNPMKGPTHDPLSVIFFCKRLKIEPGKAYYFDVVAGKQIWPMVLYVLEIDEIEVEGIGKRRCFRIKPEYQYEGIFERAEGGRVDLWVDCEWRIPIRLEADIPTLTGTLTFTVLLSKTETVTVSEGEPEGVPKWTADEIAKLAPEPGGYVPEKRENDDKDEEE